jgi:hypothetical protein
MALAGGGGGGGEQCDEQVLQLAAGMISALYFRSLIQSRSAAT